MNIKRIIDKNNKLIGYIVLIIILILFAIKSLNSYYEKDEERRKTELTTNKNTESTQNENITGTNQNNNKTENDSIQNTLTSFVNYCNNREIENAYNILTEECKEAMFPTVQNFESAYINNIFNVKRTFEKVKWSTDGNKTTYLVKLYGDILSTGSNSNYTEDYYTFVEDENGIYKLNINNFIYGEDRNLEQTVKNVTIKIGKVEVYEEYERVKITITNNTSKTISLTGDKYAEKIYLENTKGVTFSALNSKFDKEEIILAPKGTQTLWVEFNKVYSTNNKAQYLVLSDVILDYESYKESNSEEYSYRTSIKVPYQK